MCSPCLKNLCMKVIIKSYVLIILIHTMLRNSYSNFGNDLYHCMYALAEVCTLSACLKNVMDDFFFFFFFLYPDRDTKLMKKRFFLKI